MLYNVFYEVMMLMMMIFYVYDSRSAMYSRAIL